MPIYGGLRRGLHARIAIQAKVVIGPEIDHRPPGNDTMGGSNAFMGAEEGIFQFKAGRCITDQRHFPLARQFAKTARRFHRRRVITPARQPRQ